MQRNTQLLLIFVILLASILLGQVFMQQDDTRPVSDLPTTKPPTSGRSLVDAPNVFVEQSSQNLAIRKTDAPVDLWVRGTSNLNMDIPGAQIDVEGAVQIQFDTSSLRSLQRGDKLVIEIPQTAKDYSVNIDKVVQHPGGITVIQARQDDDVRLIMTLGQRNTFANLATLDGNFELVGNTSVGWLMPAENMDPNLDPSIPDFVALPARRVQRQTPTKRQRLN